MSVPIQTVNDHKACTWHTLVTDTILSVHALSDRPGSWRIFLIFHGCGIKSVLSEICVVNGVYYHILFVIFTQALLKQL